jgi:hypothetical protein
VTKKDLEAKYGRGKEVIVRETLNHPEVLERYRGVKSRTIKPPLSHREIAEETSTAAPDWDLLLEAVVSKAPGKGHADPYHKAVMALFTALFYPHLANPQAEYPIHDGRKRIDITFTNLSQKGFFSWLSHNFSAAHVFVECKNYGREIGNPELDQLAGRFSPSRGRFGLLVCRSFERRKLFVNRCRDTVADGRGWIIGLEDKDLALLVQEAKAWQASLTSGLLKKRFDEIIM